MITLYIIALIVTFGYIYYIKLDFNVTSISQSHYMLTDISSKLTYVFWGWTVVVSFLIFPMWVSIMPERYEFVSFLSIVSLIGVGCTPKYLSSDRIAHCAFAIGTGLFALVSNSIMGYGISSLVIIASGILIPWILDRDDILYWAETSAFVTVFLTIGIQIL